MFTTLCLFRTKSRVQITEPLIAGGVRKSTASKRRNTMSDGLLTLLTSLTSLIEFIGSVGG
ncbi:hypothetical protein EEB14_47860 [Rhodococcus sp. WS4]|nr:hypothetical protein EEB14_47860 [Rhodococcus sp. WS4]